MHASHDCFHDTLCSRGNSDSRNTYPTGLHCLRVHADVSFQDICPFARQIAHQVFRLFDHALKKSGTPLLAKFVRREQVRVFDDPSHGYLIDHRAALAVRAVTGDTNTARAFREALNARDAGNAEGDDHAHAN